MASSFYNVDPAEFVPLPKFLAAKEARRRMLRSLSIGIDRVAGALRISAARSERKAVAFRADGSAHEYSKVHPITIPLSRFEKDLAFLRDTFRRLMALNAVKLKSSLRHSFLLNEPNSHSVPDYVPLTFAPRVAPNIVSRDIHIFQEAAINSNRFAQRVKVPIWYLGFVRESSIDISFRCSDSVIMQIEFGNDTTGRTTINKHLTPFGNHGENNWHHTIARRIPWEDAFGEAIRTGDVEDVYTLLHFLCDSIDYGRSPNVRGCARLMDVDGSTWARFRTTDCFKHVRLSVLGGGAVTVTGLKIRLNNEIIYDGDHASPKFYDHVITSDNPIRLDTKILRYRLSQVGIGDIPKVETVLSAAARHIGESWNPAWPGSWPNEKYGDLVFWDSVAENWCNEFSSLIINRTMGLNENDDGVSILDEDVNETTKGIVPWFKCFRPTRWIGNTTGTFPSKRGTRYQLTRTPYDELGSRVRPGDYMTVGGQKHATFFVSWGIAAGGKDGTTMIKKSDFQPEELNPMITIGGNQGDVVNVEPRNLVQYAEPDARNGINWSKTSLYNSDGFGTTKLRLGGK